MAAPWENNYQNLVGQLQQIQSKVDVYKGGSPLQASQHINNIATSLARDYGISSLSDIGVRQVPEYSVIPSESGFTDEGNWYRPEQKIPTGNTVNEYYNKNDPTKIIPENKFASEGAGKGYSNYNLQAVPDGKGGTIVLPVQQYSLSGFSEFTADFAPIFQVAAVALLFVPGLGQTVGASILGGSAATVAAAVGLSEVAVATAVGSAAISSGMTALQGGSVEDVLKAGISAGAAVGVNFAAGGGVTGAAAGSAVGTTIQGGNASQVLTNAFAAGVGAGVQGAMTENPDAGKILGSAARTYIATGGDMDKTLLNTAATAIGTLDNPAKTEQQAQAAVTPASDAAAQETAVKNIEDVTQSDAARQQELADYQEKLNQYAIDKAIYEQTYGPIDTATTTSTVLPETGTTLPSQTIVATTPDVSPVVTDLDLVRQVAEQPTPTVDFAELERVLVQGQGANVANVAPVVTDVSNVDQVGIQTTPAVDATELERVTIQGQREANIAPVVTDVSNPSTTLEPVTIQGQREANIAPVVTGLDPVTVTAPTDALTPVAPAPTSEPPPAPEVKTEEPKKEEEPKEKPKEEPKKYYPTVTTVPPPKRPGRQPIITGESPSRLLADALAAYRPSGAIEGGESGKERQNVWNEKSLRLKDALGL
jgi:hypothetical protein